MHDIPYNLRHRVASAAEAASLIENGHTLAIGGYTSAGYPKAVPRELLARKRDGEALTVNLLSGSMAGQVDEILTDLVGCRVPMFESPSMRRAVNERRTIFIEQQIAKLPRLLRSGALGRIDVTLVEAMGFTEEGHLIPTSSVGLMPLLLEMADQIIVEINSAQPIGLEGVHDVFLPGNPPDRRPIPLEHPAQRIGEPFVRVDQDKIRYIVRTDEPDQAPEPEPLSGIMVQVTNQLLNFLEIETARRWPRGLPPIQSGVGNLAYRLVSALGQSAFKDLTFFCGTLNEAGIELLLAGQAIAASTSAVQMTPRVTEIIRAHGADLKKSLVIRNQEVTNDVEPAARLGILALNTGLEVDIYGNVNTSHIGGTHVVNGLGGGANFAQNSELSIVLLPSSVKGGAISGIVPMTPHVDIGEHDVDILITEQGVADLRGKDNIECASAIIDNCAHPAYRENLRKYLDRAVASVGGHHPHLLGEAFDWHLKLRETGSMAD
ncbi:MAG: hypothetical protein LBF58_08300 [Deltaproteobacteria bacterium]|jgi:succinyl-CoA:acetate CoA-transferase|nr:hypothetical protein [Deltaproteobacteria bacterium]